MRVTSFGALVATRPRPRETPDCGASISAAVERRVSANEPSRKELPPERRGKSLDARPNRQTRNREAFERASLFLFALARSFETQGFGDGSVSLGLAARRRLLSCRTDRPRQREYDLKVARERERGINTQRRAALLERETHLLFGSK